MIPSPAIEDLEAALGSVGRVLKRSEPKISRTMYHIVPMINHNEIDRIGMYKDATKYALGQSRLAVKEWCSHRIYIQLANRAPRITWPIEQI